MPYNHITIDHKNLTIMGVPFASSHDLESIANVLGTVMFEGSEPTPKGIEIIRDDVSGKITIGQVIQLAKRKEYT